MRLRSRFVLSSTLAFLIVGFLALLGIVGMTLWLGERAQVHFSDVIQARDTRAAAAELRASIQAAESSQRGFLVLGNEIYLAPFDAAKTQAQRQLESLRRLLAQAPQSAAMLDRLGAIVGEKIAEMDETVALKRARRDAEALALFRSNRGKALMDEANVFLSGIVRTADAQLTAGVAEQRSNATWLRTVSIIGALVIVAVVGGAALSILRYTGQLRLARDEVSVLNAELEQRVRDRTADLAQVNEEIQRFAYIVTHDLRAPLVNIMGFTAELEGAAKSMQALIDRSELAKETTDAVAREARIAATEDLPEAIGFIRSSTKKMDNLINAILKLSREGRRALRPEPIDLREIVETSLASLRHQIGDVRGEVKLDLRIETLHQDRLAVEQIVGNLLDNAVKYSAKDRPLRIEVAARPLPAGRLELAISDNGRGIAEHDRERIFELFRRSGVQDQPGEGIGLAYVRAVVRNLGGDISLTSALDKGTTFRVVLPVNLQASEGVAS
jgi:signal transduction histidine kinase